MNADDASPEVALVSFSRRLGFTVEAVGPEGEYVVTATEDGPPSLRARLSLPNGLLVEYLRRLDETPDATAGLGALGITEIHLEEALTVDSRSRTLAVGVRRARSGEVEWFWEREPSSDPIWRGWPIGEWRAERPGQTR